MALARNLKLIMLHIIALNNKLLIGGILCNFEKAFAC